MRIVAIEVAGIDDDMAEQAVKSATKGLSDILQISINKLNIEPHDDTRGVWARIAVPRPENLASNFEQLVANAYKALVLLALGPANKSASVHVTVRDTEEGE
jgi:hypothetical protein